MGGYTRALLGSVPSADSRNDRLETSPSHAASCFLLRPDRPPTGGLLPMTSANLLHKAGHMERMRALWSLLAAALLCPLLGECAPAREPSELPAQTGRPGALSSLSQEAGREMLKLEELFAGLEALQKEASSCLREPATTDREALRGKIVVSMTRLYAVENELFELR